MLVVVVDGGGWSLPSAPPPPLAPSRLLIPPSVRSDGCPLRAPCYFPPLFLSFLSPSCLLRMQEQSRRAEGQGQRSHDPSGSITAQCVERRPKKLQKEREGAYTLF